MQELPEHQTRRNLSHPRLFDRPRGTWNADTDPPSPSAHRDVQTIFIVRLHGKGTNLIGAPRPLYFAPLPITCVLKLQILLQDNSVFEMLALAQELGVDELRNTCEDHVTSTLSVPSACTFLAAAMDIQDRTPGKNVQITYNAKQIIESTLKYVRKNLNSNHPIAKMEISFVSLQSPIKINCQS